MQKFIAEEFLSRFLDIENVELLEVVRNFELSAEGPWLAGGAIRRTLINQELDSDFDFFFKDQKQHDDFKKKLEARGAKKINESAHAQTYMLRLYGKDRLIQLITMNYYESAEKLLDSFDFTITQLAYDGVNLYAGDFTLWDLPRKRLALHKLTFGVATMRRMIKYTDQGFTACNGVMKSILDAVVKNPQVINAETPYID
ncbi:hypothetical protein [Paenibacillus alvei]|uniref:hypothetical protein n=1 Tax=Paenibacillus alvei TaxID=44250 RepID=UPI0022811431|nr:hypothetical protein [Paenibacillus alvei]